MTSVAADGDTVRSLVAWPHFFPVVLRHEPSRLTLGLLTAVCLLASCAPSLTAVREDAPPPPARGVSIALVDFLPLAPGYPPGTRPFDVDGGSELFEPTTKGNRIFVPRDYQTIISNTLSLSLRAKGSDVTQFPSLTEALESGAQFIVHGVITECQAARAPQRGARGFTASIGLHVVILEGTGGVVVWRGDLTSRVEHSFLRTVRIDAEGSDVLSINELSFHPLRALIAHAVYNASGQIATTIVEVITHARP